MDSIDYIISKSMQEFILNNKSNYEMKDGKIHISYEQLMAVYLGCLIFHYHDTIGISSTITSGIIEEIICQK